MFARIVPIEVTKVSAVCDEVATSGVTVRVAGAEVTAVAVTSTPGSRFVKVLDADVMVCCAAVPAQSVADASCATLMVAAPGSDMRSVAVPAVTSAACRGRSGTRRRPRSTSR